MKLTVKELLSLPSMKTAKLIGGFESATNKVKDIMVLEYTDVEHWIEPGQVLLTSLYGIESSSNHALENFIQKVVKYDGAGLIVKSGRFVADVPPSLIEACNLHGLPLIEISKEVKYSDIILEVTQRLFYEKTEELEFYYQTHNKFMNLLKKDLSFEKILTLLASLLTRKLFFKHNNKVIFSTDNFYEDFETIESLSSPFNIRFDSNRILTNFKKINKTMPLVSINIYNDNENSYTLYVVEEETPLSVKETTVIENAYSLLRAHATNIRNMQQIKQSLKDDLLDIILFNTSSNEHTKTEALEKLNLETDKNYRLLSVALPKNKVNQKAVSRITNKVFSNLHQTPTYKLVDNKLILIVRIDKDNDLNSTVYKNKLSSIFEEWDSDLFDYIFISDVTTVHHFPDQMAILRDNDEIIQKIDMTQNFFITSDISIYKLILEYSRNSNIHCLIPNDLLCLYQQHHELFDTFTSYMVHNQNALKTADAIYVHPKTIAYRLKKISSIINIDFEDGISILKYTVGATIIKLLF